jgi:hypothetical protein
LHIFNTAGGSLTGESSAAVSARPSRSPAPDLDGLSLLGGHEAFYRYHHILFHKVGAVLGVAVLTGLFLWRRMYVWLLVVFSFGMHIVEDYFTVSWNQYPWRPFASSAVNFASHMPGWVVQGVLQSAAMCFILWITIRIYLRHHRTPLSHAT